MKNTFRKLTVGFGLLLACLGANAQLLLTGSLTNSIALITTRTIAITGVQLYNPNSGTVIVRLYDNDSATSSNVVRGAYTTGTQTVTTNSTVFTNAFGNLQTNAFRELTTTYTTNAAVTNEANLIWPTIVMLGGTTVNIQPTTMLAVTKGLNAYSISTNVSYAVTYWPLP